MLKRLPVEMVEFMLRTSILDRLTAPLCETVTGVEASQSMLEAIAARQLLLEPMDLEGHWFRYHHLMGEYLRLRLETQYRDEVPELHRRACKWYAEQEFWTDAVRHAIAAGATEDALSLDGPLRDGARQERRPAHAARLATPLPCTPDAGASEGHAGDRLGHGARDALQRCACDAGYDRARRAGASADADGIRWECQAIRSVVAALQDDPQRALVIAQALP